MACDATRGRKRACNEQQGGVLELLINSTYTSGLLTSATFDSDDQITAFASALTLYKYEVRGDASNLTFPSEVSGENGTSFVNQTLTVTLPKLTKEDRKEFKLLKAGSSQVIVRDYNGNYLMMGIQNGCTFNIEGATGGARGDLSGYTLTITATEQHDPHFVSSSIIDDTTNTTVTEGSAP